MGPAAAEGTAPPVTAVTNIQTVIDLERETLRKRTGLERLTDLVSAVAGSPEFIVIHLVWFTLWIGLNLVSPGPFDPYPFRGLTLLVSLEAIVLTVFVLMAQIRMAQLADKRAHLSLQMNLLAEQELTAILKVLSLVAGKIGVEIKGSDPLLDELLRNTDIKALAQKLTRELATVDDERTKPGDKETEAAHA